jgi:hypothetical protein
MANVGFVPLSDVSRLPLAPCCCGDPYTGEDCDKPAIRLGVIGSPTNCAATKPAAIGLTVIVLATRVGVVLASAKTQRINAGIILPLRSQPNGR